MSAGRSVWKPRGDGGVPGGIPANARRWNPTGAGPGQAGKGGAVQGERTCSSFLRTCFRITSQNGKWLWKCDGTTCLSEQKVLFSLGGSFLYYADRFKIYSAFCASHTKVPKVLAKGKNKHNNHPASCLWWFLLPLSNLRVRDVALGKVKQRKPVGQLWCLTVRREQAGTRPSAAQTWDWHQKHLTINSRFGISSQSLRPEATSSDFSLKI